MILHTLTNLLKPQKHLSLFVIFVQFDRGEPGESDRVFTSLQGYLSNIKGCKITYIRVNNKVEGGNNQQTAPNNWLLEGDNKYNEFSGWQRGIEFMTSTKQEPKLILFANDMFLKPGPSFLQDYANKALLEKSLRDQTIIGRIDTTGELLTIYDYDVSNWICSNCFLVPKKAIDEVGDIVTIKENLDYFLPRSCPKRYPHQEHQEAGVILFNKNAPISDSYKTWLVEWITNRWHSRIDITPETWERFRTKVRNILNESLLTARFSEAGFMPQKYGEKYYY